MPYEVGLVEWSTMNGLLDLVNGTLHLVQQWGDWSWFLGRCTNCHFALCGPVHPPKVSLNKLMLVGGLEMFNIHYMCFLLPGHQCQSAGGFALKNMIQQKFNSYFWWLLCCCLWGVGNEFLVVYDGRRQTGGAVKVCDVSWCSAPPFITRQMSLLHSYRHWTWH